MATTEATGASEDLRAEHRGVLRMLGILEGVSKGLRGGKLPPRADFEDIIDFLKVFVDQCHHHKEEALLFPALRDAAGEDIRRLLDELLAEHTAGRQRGAALTAGAVGATPQDGPALADAIHSYVALLREHIAKEEDRLFPEADRLLREDEGARLAEGYDRVEEEIIGQGRHEAFHAMLEHLEARYAV